MQNSHTNIEGMNGEKECGKECGKPLTIFVKMFDHRSLPKFA